MGYKSNIRKSESKVVGWGSLPWVIIVGKVAPCLRWGGAASGPSRLHKTDSNLMLLAFILIRTVETLEGGAGKWGPVGVMSLS